MLGQATLTFALGVVEDDGGGGDDEEDEEDGEDGFEGYGEGHINGSWFWFIGAWVSARVILDLDFFLFERKRNERSDSTSGR